MQSTAAASLIDTLHFYRVLFLICPTGTYCREDRCQSYFAPQLIPSMRPPLEECEAAGALRAIGVTSAIIDAPAENLSEEEVVRRINVFVPDLIVVTITFGSLHEDLVWITRLKKHFSCPIGIRGAPAYVQSEEILRSPHQVDFTVVGDYEVVFQHIVERGLANAPGVYLPGRIGCQSIPTHHSLDELPLPDRRSITSRLYTVRGTKIPQATIHVQRGCPFPCSYCLVHVVSGKKVRHRSPAHIIEEIRSLVSEGISHFYFRAETFTLDKDWVLALCAALEQKVPGIRWVTTTRVDCVSQEVLAAMKRAGCYGISFGIDVVSATLSVAMKKPYDKEAARNALRWCDNVGILSLAYIMIGFAGETEATLQETREQILELRPDLITIHFAHPYPGTPYYKELARASFALASKRAQAEPALLDATLTPQRLQRFSFWLTVRHYLRIRVLYSLLRKLLLRKLSVQ